MAAFNLLKTAATNVLFPASAVEINVPCFVVQSSSGETLFVKADLDQKIAAVCAAAYCGSFNIMNPGDEAVVRRGTARISLGDVIELEDLEDLKNLEAELATAGAA